MARPRGSKTLKNKIQQHILCAIKDLELNRPSNLTKLLVKSFEEDVKGTLSAVSKYMPKEVNSTLEVNNVHELRLVELDETLAQLHGMARDAVSKLEAESPEKSLLN